MSFQSTSEVASAGNLFGIMPTYRRPRELRQVLMRLAEQSRQPDRLVIVDNAPSDETCETIRDCRRSGRIIDYLPSTENLGFCGGVAFGMDHLLHVLRVASDDDWIVVFDDDDPPPSDSVLADLETFADEMLQQDENTGAVGLVGGRFDWRRGCIARVPDVELDGPVSVDFIGGNHFPMYRVSALRTAGVFSKDIFFGLSEVEHGLRLRSAGFSIYAHGKLWRERRAETGRLGHVQHASARLPTLNWRRYYSLRNSIHILRSHGRTLTAIRVTIVKGIVKPALNLIWSPRLASRHLALNLRACRDAWTGRMGRSIEPDGLARPES